MTDGAHQITTTPASGITSPALTVTIDTTAPATPAAPDLTAGTDTGSSNTDNNTGDNTPTFAGTGSPGDTITIKDGTTVLGVAVVAPDGTWTFTSPVLSDGVHQITTTASDTAGNVSAPSPTLAVTIDTTAPATPAAPDLTAGTDTGSSSTDNNTGDNTPDFNVGVVPAGTTPVLYVDGVAVPATATTDGSGNTILTPVTPLTDGAHSITTGLVDTAGNTSAISPVLGVTIDTAAPAAPTAPDLTTGTDTGSSSTDNNTGDNTPDFNVGVVPAGTNPVLYVDGVAVPATVSVVGGNTILTPVTPLTEGAHSITTGLVDTAGNTSAPSPALAVTIDTTLPATPAAPDLTAGTDTGSSSTDNITKFNTPVFTGSGSPGDTITIKDGATVLGTAVVAPNGTWTFTSSVLTDGVHQITTTATDTAGNTSVASPALAVTIDTTAPTLAAALNASSDTGTVGDGITSDTTPTISGTGTNGDTITVIMPGSGEVLTAVVVNGVWSVTPTYALTDGTLGNAVVTATDTAGNVSAPANVPLDIRSAPVAVAITSITNDTGTSSTDGVTTDATPTISGTSDQPNRPVTVTIAGVSFVVMSDNNGAWSVDTGALAATSGTWDKAVGLTTDGLKAITVSVSGGNGGTGTASGSITLDTAAPTVLVTSVFGDSVATAANGTFDGTERGFNTANYTLNSTVSPLPVISGTTTAEDGQVVTVTLAGKSYTSTAASGAWQVQVPSADAVLLNHGNTYAISASVSDKAGNAAVPDTNNGVLVNIAPPDVPTVVSQSTLSTTPTITGLAQKLNGASTVNLVAGDVLTVVLKDAGGTTLANGTYTLTVGGTSSPAGLSYNTSTGAWSLAVPASVLPAGAATYNVDVSTTAAGLTRSDISSGELVIALRPTITSIPEGPTVNMTEAASSGGTPVNVGLTGTGAVAGQVITVTWGGQTYTQLLTAADIAANTVAVTVPTSVIQAETPANTSETIAVTVSLGNGVTSTPTNVAINFVTPTAPTINSAAWTSTGAGNTSSVTGIPEAYYDRQLTGLTIPTPLPRVDNQLYYSEAVASANSGTIMRVQLATTGSNPPVAGDTLTVTWGTQTLTGYTILAADITAKYVDITVPFGAISAQAYGTVPVTAVVTSAASGNSSPAASVNVTWAYDLATDNLASLSAGFAINGRSASSQSGWQVQSQGVVNVGDVNGDGYDDFTLVENTGGAKYVVYGRAGLTAVELSTLTTVGSTNGFIISGGTSYNTTAGDYNGDGLNDILVQNATTGTYVVLGSTTSPGAINVTSMTASQGFKITSNYNVVAPTFIGDVNGDGLDDMMVNFEVGASGVYGNYVLYGSTNTSDLTLPTGQTGTFSNGFFINTGSTSLVSGGRTFAKSGDFNGDGYSDFVLNTYNATNSAAVVPEYVFFGGSNLTGITSSSMSVAGTGRGFAISGLTGNHIAFYSTTTGDINGDGMDDMIFNDGQSNAANMTYVLFGKASDTPVNVSALAAGSGGFAISGEMLDVDVVGDFNGDGLADMVVSQTGGAVPVNGNNFGGSFLLYGRTATSAITLSNVAPSEGFRINGPSNAGSNFGQSVSAGGDINGDGFADLIITAPADDPTAPARTDAGITRVIFGGPTALNSMTFQAANGDAIGTNGANTLTGTSGANQIVAGDGNDTLMGAGGADVLFGGRGDDTLIINASNIIALTTNSGNNSQAIARIDGGSGTDTLEITASLDLNAIRPAAIQSIERINMSASGITLTMGLLDVLGLSEKNNPFNTATGWTATSTGGATNWDALNNGAQVVVDGTNTNDLYLSGSWQSIGTVQNTVGGVTKTYKVLSDVTKAEAQVLVDSNVKVHLASTILTTANELPNTLNMTEASDGTPVRLSLVDTDAAGGNTITLNWGGQTVTVTLTATDISNGYVNVPVDYNKLIAETPSGTSEAVVASVTLLSGSTVVAQSSAQSIDVNFITPTTPIIAAGMAAATLWSTTNTTSSLAGIPEAYFGTLTSTMPTTAPANVDNALWYSEAVTSGSLGTVLRVALPTSTPGTATTNAPVPTVAGDTVTLVWGDQTLTATVSATDITNRYVDFTVTKAQLESQTFGNVTVTASVTSAASGNTSLTSPLVVNWNYDFPLDELASLSQGFAIHGSGQIGISNENQGASNVGDVNGDGFDDIEITNISGTRYVVYGGDRLGLVNVSQMTVAGNTFGFVITGSSQLQPTRGGDINGDGLSDLLIGNGANSYIVFGKATSIGQVALASLGTNGFAFTSTSSINEPSVVGDVNGDGYEDILFNNSSTFTNYLVFGGTNFTPGGSVALPTGTSGTLATGTGTGTSYVNISGGGFNSGNILPTLNGDFNGDGYSDFALAQVPTSGIGTGPVYVYYGSSTVAAWSNATLTSPTNGRGFVISGLTGQNSIKFSTANAGDINGDGLDDIAFSDGVTRAFVMFGKTNSTSVNVSDLAAGNGGFIMSGGTVTDTDVVGDFNGDGLADMVVSNESLSVGGSSPVGGAYLVYGRTATTALTLDALTATEGFRINGLSSIAGLGYKLGRTAIGGGDINGDGLADLVITTYGGETASGVAQGGITRVVYGGVTLLEPMVFQTANGDAIGTTGADALPGTSGNNQLVGGDGNDTLIGNGGADVLYGGRGNDQIVLNADNLLKLARNSGNDAQAVARIDGGTGLDTLDVNGDGLLFDLTAISNLAITGIERIDITSSTTGNEVKLSRRDLLALAGTDNSFNTTTGWAVASSNGASGWGSTNQGNQLVVDGSSRDTLTITNSYRDIGNVTQGGNTFRVFQSGTGLSQVIVDADMNVRMPPTLVSTSDFEWTDGLIQSEAQSGGGTVLRVSIKDTGAIAGNAVRINWGAQTVVSSALSSTDLSNGYVEILVPTAILTAVTPNGSSGTVAVSADLLTAPTGGNLVSAADTLQVAVNFITANAPIISATAWASGGASSSTGIPEALYAVDWTTGTIPSTGNVENTLFKSEAINGTIVRVQLPTSGVSGVTVPAVAGDTVRLNWGSQVINSAALTSTDITNKYVDITVPAATLDALGYGSVAVTAQVVSPSTGNASLPSGTVTVSYAFDLPLTLPGNQTTPSYGFSINGNTTRNSYTGGGAYAGGAVSKLGDINGDGYEDVLVAAPLDATATYGSSPGAAYVVYGGTRMATVELSAMQSAGTSNGFKINPGGGGAIRTGSFGLAGELDFNGDGLPDYLVASIYANNTRNGGAFLLYGSSTGQAVQLSSLDSGANTALGFRIDKQTSLSYGGIAYNSGSGQPSGSGGNAGAADVGDLNGDGLEDIAIGQSLASSGTGTISEPGRVVVLFGSTTARSNLVLPAFSGLSVAGGFILQGDSRMGPMLGSTVAGEGDINGDGYTDLLVTTTNTGTSSSGTGAVGSSPVGTGYVLYGANTLASLNVTEFSSAGFSKGFVVSNIGQSATSSMAVASKMDFVGDVNGDGLDDIVVPGVTEAKVIFGRATGGNVDAAQIGAAGNTQGFAIKGMSGSTSESILTRVAGIGDFNGDGLDDMIAVSSGRWHAWLIYGQTGNTTVDVSNLQPSQGFWIKPFGTATFLTGVDGAGDVNGDGFADLIIGSGEDTAAGRTEKSGMSFIIFGGLSDMQSMTFQTANGDVIGTSAAESLSGTAGANQIVAGDGNDTVTGNGGADVMYGGRGNDTFVLNADNLAELALSIGNASQDIARINGGTGIDALQLAGAGVDFDLSQVRRSALEGIERIDINGSGDNTLRLRLIDVLNFGDNNIWNASNTNGVSGEALAAIEPRRQLRLEGNAGDTVDLADFANWTRASNEMVDGSNFAVWNHNSALAQLLISPAMAVV